MICLSTSIKVNQITNDLKNVNTTVKILQKTNERTVTVKRDNSQHRICTFLAGDDTGSVNLNIWDDDIDRLKVNDQVEIKNGYVSEFRNTLYLNVGRFGTIDINPSMTSNSPIQTGANTMKIDQIVTAKFNLDLLVKVAEISEIRKVTVKKDNSRHDLRDILIGDDTGCIILTLWDDNISKINGYNTYLIKNAYLSKYNGGYRLNLARTGSIQLDNQEVSVNLFNNLSLLDV